MKLGVGLRLQDDLNRGLLWGAAHLTGSTHLGRCKILDFRNELNDRYASKPVVH
jgi:hypothetical protein